MRAGRETAGAAVLDEFLIQNAHPQLPAAIKGRVKVASLEAVGIIETKEVASAIYAGDAAAKAAQVTLIEARNQPGAKGMVVLTGDVVMVQEVGGDFRTRAEVRNVYVGPDHVPRLCLHFLDAEAPPRLVSA